MTLNVNIKPRRALALAGALAALLLLGACGSTPGVRGASAPVPSRVSNEQASEVTVYAVGLVGTPYRYGGNTPDSGFDCSGLIGHVYKTRTGLSLPRSVAGLQHWGQALSADEIRSGDLVFFGRGDVPTHAGIYVGNGRFVHAPSTGGTVRLDHLSAKYWAAQRVAFRRP
ncbi:MAG: C40 family peptidase [Polaromonas sp.]